MCTVAPEPGLMWPSCGNIVITDLKNSQVKLYVLWETFQIVQKCFNDAKLRPRKRVGKAAIERKKNLFKDIML